jgi:opacity protein-like surface antigen
MYKKLLGLLAIACILATSNTFSQTSNFTGPSLALYASHVDAKNDIEEVTGLYANKNTTTKKNNLIPGVDFNYGFAIENNFVIGLGATYDLSKTKTGEATRSFDSVGDAVTIITNNELKDHYSLYIQPTYVINKDSAMFAKLGKHFAKANYSWTHIFNGASDGRSFSNSSNIEGWGYGLGFKNFLSNNLFVQGEVGIVNYEKFIDRSRIESLSMKPETVNATISVGYKF